MPNRPSRIIIPIWEPSHDGRYWGRYPYGEKPFTSAELVAEARAQSVTSAQLTAAIRMAAAAQARGVANAGLSTAIRLAAQAGGSAVASASFGSIAPDLIVSRNSGPAPLPVFMDAYGTAVEGFTRTQLLRQVGYSFNHGNSSAGTYARTGLSRNIQRGGPCSAHVYRSAGTYDAKMCARRSDGSAGQVGRTITVVDPNAHYSGTQTVFLSRTSDTAGAPAGADVRTNVSSWPTLEHNKRYILHDDQSFNFGGYQNVGAAGNNAWQGGQITRSGAGVNPPTLGTMFAVSQSGQSMTNCAIFDVDAVDFQCPATMVGCYFKLRLIAGGRFIASRAVACVIENHIDRNFTGPPGDSDDSNGMAGVFHRTAILDTYIHRSYEHNMRMFQAGKVFLAHSELTGVTGGSIRQALKIMSAGIDPWDSSTGACTELMVIADNLFGSSASNINFITAIGPQNTGTGYIEGTQHTVWERNRYRHGTNWVVDHSMGGREHVIRGNTNETDGGAANIDDGVHGQMPPGWDPSPGFYSDSEPTYQDPT